MPAVVEFGGCDRCMKDWEVRGGIRDSWCSNEPDVDGRLSGPTRLWFGGGREGGGGKVGMGGVDVESAGVLSSSFMSSNSERTQNCKFEIEGLTVVLEHLCCSKPSLSFVVEAGVCVLRAASGEGMIDG